MRRLLVRTGAAVLTVYAVITANFLLFRVLPGNAAANISKVPGGSPKLRAEIERQFGLDKSVPEQYVAYIKQLAHGNLGVSYSNREPVVDVLRDALLNTLPMVLLGFLVAVLVGTAMGVFAAWRRGSWGDGLMTNLGVGFYSVPAHFLGLLLILAFGSLLPTQSTSDPFALSESWWTTVTDRLQHLALPALTFALIVFGQYTVLIRSAMVETLSDDYVLTARATGARPRRVIVRQALPNAVLPVVTVAAMQLGGLVGGSVLVETVFSWPGIGRELFDAVTERDYPVMQGVFLVLTLAVVLCNFVVDLLYPRLDPRVSDD